MRYEKQMTIYCSSGRQPLIKVLETLAEDLQSRGKLDLSECFIDSYFVESSFRFFGKFRYIGKNTVGQIKRNFHNFHLL